MACNDRMDVEKLVVAYFILVSTLAYSSNLNKEATCSPGTSIDLISQKMELFITT
jgi:hypothetical protein